MNPRARHRLLRRLVIFAAALLILSLSGLGLLLFRWSGERGTPPAGRLYLPGDFERTDRLVTLERLAGSGNACYRVQVAGAPATAGTDIVCRGKALRVWVDDARLDLTVGARGVPRASIAGLRVREGDWLGSLADREAGGHPRFPLRAQGVPGVAGRAVACEPASSAAGLCLEIHDRLGRLAIVRAADGEVEVPAPGAVVRLADGDVLWLGLVPFVARQVAGDASPALILDRIDRLRPRRAAGGTTPGGTTPGGKTPADIRAGDLGGDRRWLGRLWHVESPDASDRVPRRFEIFPLRRRYTPHNLSRQRTNLEGEDVLQRLIDGGWLCLEPAPDLETAGGPRIAWRPLDRPGCDAGHSPASLSRSSVDDYRRARYGDLAYLAGTLVNATSAALAEGRYLEDASVLPFVFDWRLASHPAGAGSARRVPQPVPHRLWGVRFGATRNVLRSRRFHRGLPPTVVPRASTARHLLLVLRDGELAVSFHLPVAGPGSVCLGRHATTGGDSPIALRPTSGGHYPLGAAAFLDDPAIGTWLPDPDAVCAGCRLTFEPAGDDGGLTVSSAGACDELPAVRTLASGEILPWGDFELRHVDRGRPWLAASDPGTGRRHFAEEFSRRGRLRPLLGDAAALSGVEAALGELLADAGEVGVPSSLESLELTVDGDLQLAAAAIVDALARPQIAEDDPEPHRVSVTAVILDARGGDLLAAVNWASGDGDRDAGDEPTAWEMGSGQADVHENAALLRRGAIGSTIKIAGGYALLNNGGLASGAEIDARRGFREAPVDRGRLYLHRGARREPPSRRRCSTGPHVLPRSDAGFTTGTFIRRFAASCNNFFVMTGFRHASSRPATIRSVSRPSRWPAAGAGPRELLLDLRDRDVPTLVSPAPGVQSLAERVRDGLADDFAPADGEGLRLPRSLYGILTALGFQPRPNVFTAQGEAPAELAFDHRARPVAVPLANGWFSRAGHDAGVETPALRPGRDFSYPGVPSPGRLDEAATRGRTVVERYDGNPRQVRRFAEGRADVQWSMLMIGQSGVEASALGLASLYAPAARDDGRAVSPCLFRANCGPGRAGLPVIDPEGPDAEILNQALTAVLRDGTARGGLWRVGRRHLIGSGWGGKTGTYQVERARFVGLSRERWQRLRARACGVDGVEPPAIRPTGTRVAELARLLARAPAGSALGARACEDTRFPLNPAGVHAYRGGESPARLDELDAELRRAAETDTLIYHSFVALVPPVRGETGAPSPAQGLVVAVLVDRQTSDKSLAIQIGAELAAAVERWAATAR